MVGVGVHVYPQHPVRLGVDGRGKLLGPGEVGLNLSLPQGEPHVVGKPRVNPLQELIQVGVARPHQQPEVEVAPLAPVAPGIEALALLLPLPLQALPIFA